MAIDDNTLYGLKGSQIKDLPEKINAVKGKARELTSADYNYPTGAPDGVAMWLLDSGYYYADTGVKIYRDTAHSTAVGKRNMVVSNVGGVNGATIYTLGGGGVVINYVSGTGVLNLSTDATTNSQIQNNLTTTMADQVLDARQGKALKDMIDAITGFSYEVVQTLPASGQNGKIYLVPIDESGGPSDNYYNEYIWVNNAWEMIGTTEMDLTNYVQFSDLAAGLATKQNLLTAGANVQINNDTISAADTTYSAGTGLSLAGTQFSVDTTAIATQNDLTAGLATKQNTLTAGSNVQINNDTISATDTTYSPFTGTDGTAAGTAGLVPAPATTDAGKVLGANGTWVTGGPTVVQTTGTSTTDVMSQNASTALVYPSYQYHPSRIRIGSIATATSEYTVAIGDDARASATYGIALGSAARANGEGSIVISGGTSNKFGVARGPRSIAIGYGASAGQGSAGEDVTGAIALGAGALARNRGEMNIGSDSTTYGYNSSNYRLLTGLYDPQSAHDAATKGYVDTAISGISVPDTFTTNEWNALWA